MPTGSANSLMTVSWNSYQPPLCHLFVLTTRANCCQTVGVFEEILHRRTATRYSYTAQSAYSCALRASSSIHLADTGGDTQPTRGCACNKRNSQLPVGAKKKNLPAHATTQSHTLRRMSHRRRHILMTVQDAHNHISSKVESGIVTPLLAGCLGES